MKDLKDLLKEKLEYYRKINCSFMIDIVQKTIKKMEIDEERARRKQAKKQLRTWGGGEGHAKPHRGRGRKPYRPPASIDEGEVLRWKVIRS